MIDELMTLGMTEKQARVYVALIELGEVSMGSLQKKVGLHKQIVYLTLEDLRKKLLVAVTVKNGKKHFRAADPETLLQQNKTQRETIEALIPKLHAASGTAKHIGDIHVYEGIPAIQAFHQKMLKSTPPESCVSILGAGGEEFLKIANVRYFFYRYENLRINKKIRHNLLMYENQRTTSPEYIKRRYVNVKFLSETFQQPLATQIWPDRVAFLLFGEDPQLIEIKSVKIHEGFQNYFDVLWKIARE